MSDPAPLNAWPAARPTGISPIQHPAWEEARNAILDLAAEGPVTVVVVGEPGTGKTWLLRELASALGDHGFPTMMLMQGDLPMTLSAGAALLVDEASLMNDATRAEMTAQQRGVVVLAAETWPGAGESASPVIVRMRPLHPDEIPAFALAWLERAGLPAAMIDAGGLSRQAAQSGCTPRTIVHLLGAAAAMSAGLDAEAAEPAAAPQPLAAAPAADPIVPPAPRLPPRRRTYYRPALGISAIAAAVVLGWALMPAPPPARVAQRADTGPAQPLPPVLAEAVPAEPPALPPLRQAETPTPAVAAAMADAAPPAPVAALPPSLPPLGTAETSAPALVTASTPAQPGTTPPPLAAPLSPDVHTAEVPPDLDAAPPAPAIASALPPPAPGASEPMLVVTLEDVSAPASPARRGGPGLVLVAQRGDTLESLYGSVYRDRNAPPYAKVVAANPGPFRPGAIVVFPEPPGGWQRIQR